MRVCSEDRIGIPDLCREVCERYISMGHGGLGIAEGSERSRVSVKSSGVLIAYDDLGDRQDAGYSLSCEVECPHS